MVLLNSLLPILRSPSFLPPSFFSVSRRRLLGLGICFLRPCCYYRAALPPPPCLHVSFLFFFCHCSVAQDYSCCGAILPDDHLTPLSALVSQVAHRTYSFASLNLHRKTAGPGWPSPTKWIRGEWRRWRRIPRADIRKSPSPHNTLQILEGLSEGLPTCSTFT